MASDLSQAELVWDEYKYRHTHCWKVVFQLTAAVVFLSAVPYVDPKYARALEWRILLAPGLGVVPAAFGPDLGDVIRSRVGAAETRNGKELWPGPGFSSQ